MRAVRVEGPDGPNALKLAEVPEPKGSDGGVLIDVQAAGIGHLDLVCIRGEHQLRPSFPFTPGYEVAGKVRAAPAGSDLRRGERVAAYVDSGGYAEQVVADPGLVIRVPDDLDAHRAAALPVNVMTALYALQHRARTQAGEAVVVHGAGGGLGMAAVQVARLLGAEVFAVASDGIRADLARAAGASVVISAEDGWVERLRATLDKRGRVRADVVFDPVGGERLIESVRVLAPEGRLISVGFVAGIPHLPVNELLVRNLTLLGADWPPDDPVTRARLLPWTQAMVASGAIHPIVTRTAALAEAGSVLAALERREVAGKAVLEVTGAAWES